MRRRDRRRRIHGDGGGAPAGQRGADVVLLESAFCGWGASSRNAGHLTPTIAGDPQLLATVYRRRARELVRFADNAVHFSEGLIERLRIECEYEPNGNVSVALSTGQLRRAQRIARVLSESGGEVEFVEGRRPGCRTRFSAASSSVPAGYSIRASLHAGSARRFVTRTRGSSSGLRSTRSSPVARGSSSERRRVGSLRNVSCSPPTRTPATSHSPPGGSWCPYG